MEASAYADQAQAIIRRFLNDDDEKATVHEKQLLEKIRKELDYARKKVDEAALTLRDEKAALEVGFAIFIAALHLTPILGRERSIL